jgi:glycosyltransferase involved in cell wall biosynthesis
MKLSIIIPAYNEEKVIKKTLSDYYRYFSKIYKNNFEIIVIPNNCSDKTPDIVKNFSKNRKQIKYKIFHQKIGKGGALIKGFKIAQGDLIGFVDADNATKPDAFYDLIKKIGKYDGILASRWIKDAKILTPQHWTRKFASRCFNLLIRLFFQIKLRDTQCGAKLFKKEPLKKILPKLGITQWAFDIDLLYHLKKQGYKIKEIPTTWEEPGDSKLNIKKTSIEMFLAIVRLRLIYSPFKFIVKIYDFLFVKQNSKS